MLLPHLASRVYGAPLLLARAKLEVILAVLGERIGNPQPVASPFVSTRAAAPVAPTGIAVIPIHGTLVRRTLGLEPASGFTAYSELQANLDAAMADPVVQGILLDIDSPGGEAGGVFELADRIRVASAIKPVWAHANDSAFSAAYALAAASQRLTLSQTGGVGSIGVIALHVDQSVRDAQQGFRFTAITAGEHKDDYSPHAPLTPTAAASLQNEADRLYRLFIGQVARHRGLDVDAVRNTEAGLYFGEEAVVAGLADAVAPFDQVLAEFADSLRVANRLITTSPLRSRPTPTRTSAMQDEPATPEHAIQTNCATDQTDSATEQATAPLKVAQTNAIGATEPGSDSTHAAAISRVEVTQAQAQAQAIAELCLIAGVPQRTAEFLGSGLTEAQVRRALLEARANQAEISSHLAVDSPNPNAAAASPLLAAVKKLHA